MNSYFRLSASAGAALAAALVLAACSSKPVDKTAGWSPNRIYAEAKDEMGSGGYDKAVPLFETLEGRAAGTPLAQQAQLDKAYSQYKDGQKAEAVATLDRFLRLHPASPAVDYALYMKGVINFNDELGLFSFLSRQDLSERDQRAAKEPAQNAKATVPDSKDLQWPLHKVRRLRHRDVVEPGPNDPADERIAGEVVHDRWGKTLAFRLIGAQPQAEQK